MDRKDFKGITITGVILIVTAALVMNFGELRPYISTFAGAVFKPLFISLCIAFVVSIPADKIKLRLDRFMKKGTSALSIFLALVFIIVVLAIIIYFVVPELFNAIKVFISSMSAFSNQVDEYVQSPETKPEWVELIIDYVGGYVTTFIDNIRKGASDFISSGIQGALGAISTTISSVVSFFVSLCLALYFISSRRLICRQIRKLSMMTLKQEKTEKLARLMELVTTVFRRFITAQCTEAVILGVLCALGCISLHMPYAIMIGALTGVTALVPIYGAIAGALIGAFMIAVQSPVQGLVFIIFFIILQQLEGNLIYPKVVGSSMGLPAVYTFISVTIGGGLLGIIGMLFAVPVATIVYRILKDRSQAFEESLKSDITPDSDLN